jgi:flagellar basal body-associated protein FliL
MKKGISTLLIIFIVLLLGGGTMLVVRFFAGGPEDNWICVDDQWVKHGNPSAEKPTTGCSPKIQPSTVVPLPSGQSIVGNFFELIKEKRIPAAIKIMTKNNWEDDSTKQAWGVQFNSFSSLTVDKISPYNKEEWTSDKQVYQVDVTTQMKPESANAPIPYYGWGDGKNTRWIEIIKEDGFWRISGIATGP